MRIKAFLIVTSILLIQPVMAEGNYHWVDQHGRMHFGDQPRSIDDGVKQQLDSQYEQLHALDKSLIKNKQINAHAIKKISDEQGDLVVANMDDNVDQTALFNKQCQWVKEMLSDYQYGGASNQHAVAYEKSNQDKEIGALIQRMNSYCQ